MRNLTNFGSGISKTCNLIFRFDDILKITDKKTKDKIEVALYNEGSNLKHNLTLNINFFHMTEQDFDFFLSDYNANKQQKVFNFQGKDLILALTQAMLKYGDNAKDFRLRLTIVIFASFVFLLPIILHSFI